MFLRLSEMVLLLQLLLEIMTPEHDFRILLCRAGLRLVKTEISISVWTWPINAITIALYHRTLPAFFVFLGVGQRPFSFSRLEFFRRILQSCRRRRRSRTTPGLERIPKSIIKIPTPANSQPKAGSLLTPKAGSDFLVDERRTIKLSPSEAEFDSSDHSIYHFLAQDSTETNSIFFHFISDFSAIFFLCRPPCDRWPGTGRKLSFDCTVRSQHVNFKLNLYFCFSCHLLACRVVLRFASQICQEFSLCCSFLGKQLLPARCTRN